jgi:hypothetical protein
VATIYTLPQDCVHGFDDEAFQEINGQFGGRLTYSTTDEAIEFNTPEDMPQDQRLTATGLLEAAFCIL